LCERGNNAFHRQTNDVGERALNPDNDLTAGGALGGISAGFIERIDRRQVIRDGRVAEIAKPDARYLRQNRRRSIWGDNYYAGANFMYLSTESA
jgi:hypothetical protein